MVMVTIMVMVTGMVTGTIILRVVAGATVCICQDFDRFGVSMTGFEVEE